VQTRLRSAIILLTLAGIAGIWLVLAPFVDSYQPAGDAWITATTHHVVTGALLVVVSLAAVLTIIGTALRALATTSQTATEAVEHPSEEPAGAP
jgi:hypothetical protein